MKYREKLNTNSISVMATLGNNRIHDFFKGFGTIVDIDGKAWVEWDWWMPPSQADIDELHRKIRNDELFSKIIFPMIKQISPSDYDIKDVYDC